MLLTHKPARCGGAIIVDARTGHVIVRDPVEFSSMVQIGGDTFEIDGETYLVVRSSPMVRNTRGANKAVFVVPCMLTDQMNSIGEMLREEREAELQAAFGGE